jgi:hypothetical protein
MNLRTLSSALLATAIASLWLASVSASASVLATAGGEVFTGTIKAESEGFVTLDGSLVVSCKSTLEAAVESHGSEVPVEGKLSSLSFSECANNRTVTVLEPGSLELAATSEGNGTVKSSGTEITVLAHLPFSITTHCIFYTEETDLGAFTGSVTTLDAATIDIEQSPIARKSTDFGCGSTSELTGSYSVTSPSALVVISQNEGLKMELSPDPVIFAGKGNKKFVKIENIGALKFGPLKMEIGDPKTGAFSVAQACKGEFLTAKGTAESACENETVECVIEGTPNTFWAWATEPILVFNLTFLEC